MTKKKKEKLYIGYYPRMFILGIMFLILFIVGIGFFSKTIKYNMEKKVTYLETGDIDYTVYLKDNNFYDSDKVVNPNNTTFVSSLIDKINLTFTYNFDSTKYVKGDFNYKIVGELKVKDKDSGNEYFTKTYELTDPTDTNLTKSRSFFIGQDVEIDYDYYNNLAESFKNTYGVDTTSELDVYLLVEDTLTPLGSDKQTSNQSKTLIKIPLSDKSISITMNKQPLYATKVLINKSKVEITNIFLLLMASIVLILAIWVYSEMDGMFEKTLDKTNLYDDEKDRILTKYDKLIVNVNVMPDPNKYEKVDIKEFKELLDVRKNFNEPIRYMEVTPHIKCHFFVKHENEIFIYTLKNVDLEEEKHE